MKIIFNIIANETFYLKEICPKTFFRYSRKKPNDDNVLSVDQLPVSEQIRLQFEESHFTHNLKLAPSALAGVGLSLNPEGKEKGSWWHSTAELVLITRDAVIL